ncbi:TetR/AcrR family transcriptional regulator [Sphingomonas sp. ID0503]|uniref:TetR/AcrR family transcriptional regulator n=1 Tax=Sphingomonas sp. ID0503 TaxID=3399691 RepID=UPI003AFA1818
MAKPVRRRASRLSSEQRIANILSIAREVIRERGYEDLSMAEIAAKAGVVEGTIYRYFETKRDLLVRVAEDWFSEHLNRDPNLPSIKGTWNRLRHLVWRALEITKREPVLTRFLLTELRPSASYRSSPFFDLNRRFTGEIRSLCQGAIAAGEFQSDVSPSLLRDMIFGCIEHQTWAYLRNEGDFDINETADGITNVIYRGMIVTVGKFGDLDRQVARLTTLGDRLELALAARG